MPDWTGHIRQHLSDLPVDETRREDIVREIAIHLQSAFEEALLAGATEREANEQALQMVDWQLLNRELRKVEGVCDLKMRRWRRREELLERGGFRIAAAVYRDWMYGFRMLRKHSSFGLIVVLTLALGIGANTAIFTIVNGVLLRPLPYVDAHDLVRVWPEKVFSGRMFIELRERTSTLQLMSAYRRADFTLAADGRPKVVRGAIVQIDYFSVLGASPALGRTFSAQDERAGMEDVVILSHDLWKAELGSDPSIIDVMIDLGALGYARRRVIGVMPEGFRPLVAGTRAWVPMPIDSDSPAYQDAYGMWAIARLKPGVTASQAAAEIRLLAPEFTRQHPTQFRDARFSPVDVVPLLDSIVGSTRPTLLILWGAVGLVLLIACSNVANLVLARSAVRRQEVAVRIALGAGPSRVVRQFLAESALLGLLGGVGGLFLAAVTLSLAKGALPAQLPRATEVQLDWAVFGFAAVVSLLSALAFGAVPAWRASRIDPNDALIAEARGATLRRSRRRLNASLVTAEVGMAVVLVIGAFLMLKSFWRLHQVDVGFEASQVLAVEIRFPSGRFDEPSVRRLYFSNLFERLRGIPGVQSVGAINRLPMTGGNSGIPYLVEGQPLPEGTPSLVGNLRAVTPEYFRVLGIRLQEGRMLNEADREDTLPVALINQAMARKHWPDGGAVGKRFLGVDDGQPLFQVVGVVEDFRQHQLDIAPRPEFYLPADQLFWELSFVLLRTSGDLEAAAGEIGGVAASVDPEVPIVSARAMPEVISDSLGDPRFHTWLFAAFAAIALTLSVVGVYGVVSYSVGQRTKEIGLRMALGATSGNVLRQALSRALFPVVGGVALGAGLSLASTRFLSAMLFDVKPTDPVVFAGVALGFIFVGAAASYPPVRRAAGIDPLIAIRDQ